MLIFYLFFVSALVLALLALNLLLATKAPSTAKLSSYEAGYNLTASPAPQKFALPYFLVAILFMIFDLEILFIWPFAVSIFYTSLFGYWMFILFTVVLTVGFVYELGTGVLNWATHSPSTHSSSSTNLPPKNSPSLLFSQNDRRKRRTGSQGHCKWLTLWVMGVRIPLFSLNFIDSKLFSLRNSLWPLSGFPGV
jgi:NADH-ubiquinone oxidoreductase chain 3